MKPINQTILHFAFLFLPLAFNMPGSANNHDPYSPPANPLALNGGCITSGNQTIHYEDIPAPMTATAASGGSCSSYRYQWQWSTDQIFWTGIAGATGQNITLAMKAQDSVVNQLASFKSRYGDTVTVIGIPSYEDGFRPQQ